jgi:hypothetical protein
MLLLPRLLLLPLLPRPLLPLLLLLFLGGDHVWGGGAVALRREHPHHLVLELQQLGRDEAVVKARQVGHHLGVRAGMRGVFGEGG